MKKKLKGTAKKQAVKESLTRKLIEKTELWFAKHGTVSPELCELWRQEAIKEREAKKLKKNL